MAIIGSLMQTEMVTATPDERVSDVAQRMRDNRVGAVLVVDGDRLAGLFSERDLLVRVVAEGRDPSATKVSEVATTSLVTVSVDTHVRECARILKEKRFRHLPVLEGGKAVGILSARDFFAYVVDGLERFVDEIRYQQQLEDGLDPYDRFGGSYGG
jgi:CBS domain-containing protein